ncbi:hypothetical protein EAX61_01440 [Dokdonia sinensis]|uniref:Alpha/beta hydrolase n=1 Tax=Dokdonia sinensis TaxID=2479847 RepID=A0A3M0GHC5_9FLAO|nr:hypothetical protein [Dokdonia sinensis]RMB64070.1 hypothetical protein EAX61_01440 [Dokdonia sinensis]
MRYSLFFFLISIVATAQNTLNRGVVIPSVQMEKGSGMTHAVYLPRDYDEQKSYQTVFFFEESGKGAAAVQQFTIAAELTNSIIIAPNAPVNDSLQVALSESSEFINDLYPNYAIDTSRIILAGNGKGALVACSSAILNKTIAGVIAVDDAYIDINLLRSLPKLKFVILAGDESRNYYKMDRLESLIGKRDFIADFLWYEGDAAIPDAGYLSAAVTALMLTREKDFPQAKAFYENDLAFGDLLVKRQKHLAAFDFVGSLKAKYKFHIDDLSAQKELLKEIRRNRSFRAKRNQRNAVQEEEYFLAQDFEYYLNEDTTNAFFDNLGWWSYQMDELDAKIDSTATNGQERKAAVRLKNYIQELTESNAQIIEQNVAAPLAQKLYVNVLRTLVTPKNPEGFLKAISYSAQEGDEGAALFYLEELLKMGYKDYESLYALEGTTAIKIGAPYNEIIKAYLGDSKYY